MTLLRKALSGARIAWATVFLLLFALFNLGNVLWAYPQLMINFSAGLAAWASGSTLQKFAALLLVTAFSAAMYFLRQTQRGAYGMIECGFALNVTWYVFSQPVTSPSATAATLLGAVYVLVRGMDNVREGLKAAKAEREAEKAGAEQAPSETHAVKD
jgi:hypothetical protein